MYNTHKMAGWGAGDEIRREKGKMSKKVVRGEEDVKMGRKEKIGEERKVEEGNEEEKR